MKKKHILVVEDEEDIQQLVSFNLIKAGFNVSCADSGEEALHQMQSEKIDCVLLDWMLPGITGLDVCRQIKSNVDLQHVPIIMLTAKGEEDDIIAGLENGADDYIAKPFSPKVLVARVNTVLRRGRQTNDEADERKRKLSIHGFEIDTGRHEVQVHGRTIKLTTTEFAILELLAGRPGQVFSRQQIIDGVRGYNYMVTPRAMDVQIYGLRKKLGASGDYIETVRGIGYRLKD
ncbi:MAG: response regulator transcription factor [Thermodesulfobacteriota bacterium]|nr:response regulator transcription factor [Thermodesulfobacteriota bacterium]